VVRTNRRVGTYLVRADGTVGTYLAEQGFDVRTLRQRVGERLLASGAEMAFDHRHIASGIGRSRTRTAGEDDDPVLAQALFLVDMLGRIKVRLGLLIMPSAPRRP
jgi:hypothetical protein